ncbi:hypothetical protein ASPWEDRAFT_134914 [Aspergillus wentii DTO 134E9]|uniref:Phosphoglycerate mutase-like protein n=1 Tax=Aspergillus wentii DTO 134E9 TaxID=1073089 RepID=A0A1L9RMT4_ASPWE|nr:uncharacterized protein ASPWEDRAFT_134914 [Aspergillus wentii DTO 134E9]OJJ36193.1 hypothetical protein ASPWEDRAFT_134914 [Aspergillus wentii DTO 134E9]
MPPIVHLIRHGEGEHNINNSHHIRDPFLTENGKAQCQSLRESFPFHNDISAVLASPLKRTIQTAAYVFAPTLEERQLPLVLVPNAQEISHLTCDLGDDQNIIKGKAPEIVSQAAPKYDTANIDSSLVGVDWNSKQGIYAPRLNSVRRRAAELRCWIWNRPEKHIALVSHGGFMHYLTEDWTGYVKGRGTGYRNCEYRTFEFTEDSNEEPHLREVGNMASKVNRPPYLDAHVIHELDEVEGAEE